MIEIVDSILTSLATGLPGLKYFRQAKIMLKTAEVTLTNVAIKSSSMTGIDFK